MANKPDTRPLRAYWSKRESDLVFDYPSRLDGRLLYSVFTKEFTDELERRGYDVTTLRFSIKQKTEA